MDNKKLIAEALLEIAKNSTTEIIDSSDNKELIAAAEKIGIILPSPDLAVIKTVYAEIDKVNKNGVILPKKAVEKGIQTLVGKQINWEHDGAGRICGYTIDAKINSDEIEIIGVIFKSLFPKEMDVVKEKFAKKELAVSFEIWNTTNDGKSVVKIRPDGFKEIDPIMFHGTGLLLASKPACPKAKVFKLIADTTNIIKESIEKIFNNNLVYASLAVEESICQKCVVCNCETKEENKLEEILDLDYENGEIEEAKKLTTEQRNALPDSDFALIQEKDGKKIRRFPINDEAHVRNALARLPQAKDITEEEKKECLKKILKKAKELKMTDLLEKYKAEVANLEPAQVTEPAIEQKPVEPAQVEEAPKVIVEPEKPVKTTSYYVCENIESVGEDGGIDYSSKHYERIVRIYKDGREEIEIREGNSATDSKISKFTVTQAEAKIAEAVKVANDAKDVEINSVKAELEILKTAKETEISTLKTEVETLKVEKETLKVEKAKENQPLDLNVGNVEVDTKAESAERRKKIDERAFGKKK